MKYFLYDYIKINLAMENKDGNFNSIPFSCKKVEGLMNVLCDREQKEEVNWFPLIVNYPFIDFLSPGGTSTALSVASKLFFQGKRDLKMLSTKGTGLGRQLPKLFSRKD